MSTKKNLEVQKIRKSTKKNLEVSKKNLTLKKPGSPTKKNQEVNLYIFLVGTSRCFVVVSPIFSLWTSGSFWGPPDFFGLTFGFI